MPKLTHIPLLRFLFPFVIGIIGVVYLRPELFYLLLFFGVNLIIYLVLLFIKKATNNYKFRWIFGLLLYLNFLSAGACLTSLKYNNTEIKTTLFTSDSNQLLIGEVAEPIQVKENTVKAILTIKGIKNNTTWIEGNGKVIIYLQKDSLASMLAIGDVISFEPKLENVPPPKNPNEFDFRKYLSYHLIHQQAFLRSNNWHLLSKSASVGIFKIANDARNYLIKTLENKGLKDKELAIASALILGYKDNIDAQLKSSYSSAGAMHVLAVSGLHVGVIFLIFSKLLQFIDKIKYGSIIKGSILIIILWAYALLTGLSPSVMRAATMFSFIVAAKMTKRNSSFFNTLAASALVLLIYNPLLIMEVGFQLSYLAVIGIVIIQPWITNWFYTKWWLPRKIWEITAVSIAAQVATFPLSLLYFHQFPNYFMFSNLIVIPLALAILSLGIATLCFAFIPIIGDYLALGLNYLIKFLNYSVNLIDSLPYSLTENIRFSILDAWLLYLTIIFLIALIAYRKFKFLLASCLLLIIFLGNNGWINYNSLKQHKIVIYNIPQYSTINFIDGNDNVLVSDIKLTENRSKLMFHVQNNWINNGVENEKIVRLDHLIKRHQLSNIYKIDNPNLFNKRNYFKFYNYKLAVIDNNFKSFSTTEKLNVDALVITKNTQLTLSELTNMFDAKLIIIDASNSNYNSERFTQEAKLLSLNIWDISKNGAFEVLLM